ncbi:hypothetical protein IMZ31_24180 (plasmid) [Pontibacillus sp. ALD_SL1]|uniref:DUF7167 family protein n=1 Tax=Pontibacillus sp. ALD_SL1 TaxID=2777185 RepID=UPI001A957827|nr:hypothetical protein [Pontibacillus sp. ALD_SL1]QST02551.1 hypothetical protein IMZ31_24180 [Pontibacillus sp. ALD_SL1]
MIYEFRVKTQYVGSQVTEEVELPDDMTEVEVEEAFKEWMFEQLDFNWERKS